MFKQTIFNILYKLQEGVTDPPSVSSISRLLRGGIIGPTNHGNGEHRKDDRKDYSIHGILGGMYQIISLKVVRQV